MTLEGLVFDAEGGVKVELKLELVVDSDLGSFLASVPVKVTYQGKIKDGYLTYDKGKKIFITALTDFFHEATSYNHQHVLEIAKTYTDLLADGRVKVKEEFRDHESGQVNEVKTYETYHRYRVEVAKRELVELQRGEKLDKLLKISS